MLISDLRQANPVRAVLKLKCGLDACAPRLQKAARQYSPRLAHDPIPRRTAAAQAVPTGLRTWSRLPARRRRRRQVSLAARADHRRRPPRRHRVRLNGDGRAQHVSVIDERMTHGIRGCPASASTRIPQLPAGSARRAKRIDLPPMRGIPGEQIAPCPAWISVLGRHALLRDGTLAILDSLPRANPPLPRGQAVRNRTAKMLRHWTQPRRRLQWAPPLRPWKRQTLCPRLLLLQSSKKEDPIRIRQRPQAHRRRS